jgi:hypothetical protein
MSGQALKDNVIVEPADIDETRDSPSAKLNVRYASK